MKGALVSGGGAHGSFGVSQAEKLGNDFDIFYGWSTGALIAPLWAAGRIDVLKEVYFNTRNEDVFNVYPFTTQGKISLLKGILQEIKGRRTWGETKPLKNQIDKYFTLEIWKSLQESGKEVVIGSSSIKSKLFNVDYYSSKDLDFEEFKTAMWASASPIFYGSIVDIRGVQHTDAGLKEILNFKKAIEKGCTSLDAIIHKTKSEDSAEYITEVSSLHDYLGRVIELLPNACSSEVLDLGAEWAKTKGCDVNLIYMPFNPDFTAFQFDPVKMKQLYLDTI